MSMGGRAEGLMCTDPGARTPIGVSGNFPLFVLVLEKLFYKWPHEVKNYFPKYEVSKKLQSLDPRRNEAFSGLCLRHSYNVICMSGSIQLGSVGISHLVLPLAVLVFHSLHISDRDTVRWDTCLLVWIVVFL